MTPRLRVSAVTFVVILALGCVRTRPDVVPSGPILLALVTWNMNGGRGDLPRFVDELAAGRLTGAPARDYILLLQEAIDGGERDARAVAAARGLTAHYSPVRRSVARTSGNAVVATMPLSDVRVIDLPRERQPRAAIAATTVVGGEKLFVVATHLENRLGWLQGLFGDRARGRQAEALLQAIPAQGYGILGGDMNTMLGPTEPAWRAFLERFPDTPERPLPTFRDRLVLDHLFFDLPAGWTATRRVLPDRYGSDHHPVIGTIHAGSAAVDPERRGTRPTPAAVDSERRGTRPTPRGDSRASPYVRACSASAETRLRPACFPS